MTVVVVDTSVYVSALVFGGTPRVAVDVALTVPFRLAVSAELKTELVETLGGKFDWPGERIERSCALLWERAMWCEPVAVQACRDPDDDHVLGCAVAAGAHMLMTGDRNLLLLHPFGSISIVTPATFLEMCREVR